MAALLEALSKPEAGAALNITAIILILATAAGLGLILVVVTYYASKILGTNMVQGKANDDPRSQLLTAANQLFLCVGLAGTMLLVNENIVRAFAIIAALSLIRFRIRLDNKGISASLLFSILAGMACGLQELQIAWALTGAYVILLSLVVIQSVFLKASVKTKKKSKKNKPIEPGAPVIS